ncbi:hypothetical protein JCM3765_004046 [Sporobolomyces pararoseus]
MQHSDLANFDLEALQAACEEVHSNMGMIERIFGNNTMVLGQDINMKLMTVLENESNAARRLLQLVYIGKEEVNHTLSVMRYLEKPDSETPDLSADFKKRLKRTIRAFNVSYKNQVEILEEDSDEDDYDPANLSQQWTPILFNYELYKGHAKNNAEMGELVFAHKSRSKFVLFNLCDSIKSPEGDGNLEEDYETRLASQVQRFLALAYYLPIGNIEWIRATYTTLEHPRLHPKLLSGNIKETVPAKDGAPPLLHLTGKTLQPCLTSKDLLALDTFISTCNYKVPNEAARDRVLLGEGVEDPTVFKFKYLDLNLGKPALKKKCDSCKSLFDPTQLKACSACRSVLYCSRDCQKIDWKGHKELMCRE